MIMCPYCNNATELVDSAEIYRRSYGMIYLCRPCDAFVGCHRGTTKPLGTPANRKLRKRRIAAHNAFDPVWRSGKVKRKEAYKMLAEYMGIDGGKAHIAMFDEAQCEKVLNFIKEQEL